jgi:mono/diheme cytochrome c family protein
MKKALKWIAIVLGALVLVLVVVGAAIYPSGAKALARTFPNIHVAALRIPSDDSAAVRGKHVSIIWGCTRCHGADLGGTLLANDLLLGTISASNLTRGQGGVGESYSDVDWVRAIRHGVSPDGAVLALMLDYSTMSDRDLGDLIAYLKQLPPVDKEQAEVRLGPVVPLAPALGLYTPQAEVMDHNAARPADPAPGATVDYGRYLFQICRECHTQKLAGNLGDWTQADFARTLHTGILPSGKSLPAAMRSPGFGELNDTELTALWMYLREIAN